MLGPASLTLPDREVTIQVISVGTDNFCLCIALGTCYYVYIFHSGIQIESNGPIMPGSNGTDLSENIPITFLHINQYIVVYSPGRLLHLIDVSSAHESTHHVRMRESPRLPNQEKELYLGVNEVMPMCQITAAGNCGIFIEHQTLYQVQFTMSSVLKSYQDECSDTRINLLHLALCHMRDISLARCMVVHSLLQNPSHQLKSVLQEFLLSSTYYHIQKLDTDPLIMTTLPMSEVSNQNSCRTLRTTNIQSVTKQLISAQVKPTVTPAGPFIRFSLSDFVQKYSTQVTPHSVPNKTLSPPQHSPISTHTSSPHPQGAWPQPVSSQSGGSAALSSRSSSSESSITSSTVHSAEEEGMLELMSEALEYHVRRRCEAVPRAVCHNAAQLYFNQLIKQAKMLLSLILVSVNKTPDWIPKREDLLHPPTPELVQINSACMVLKLVLLEFGCPVPPAFDWIHVFCSYKVSYNL